MEQNIEQIKSVIEKKAKIYNTKNPNQILSIAPEHKGLGLKCYDKGGLAVVAREAPESWVKNLGADVRSVLAYHSESTSGNIMIARIPSEIMKNSMKMNSFAFLRASIISGKNSSPVL